MDDKTVSLVLSAVMRIACGHGGDTGEDIQYVSLQKKNFSDSQMYLCQQ